MLLSALPPLLADEEAVAEMVAQRTGVVAVAQQARAPVLAALGQIGGRAPLLVVTATAAEAEHLVHDLRAFVAPERVDMLPAWETLPFERVSPSAETMGHRLRVLWHLRHDARAADAGRPPGGVPSPAAQDAVGEPAIDIVVAPARALVQRLAPSTAGTDPVVVRRGATTDRDELVERLVGAGYRREFQAEHRGEVAVRGGIVDVFPATGAWPVRIELWGDEVDRLVTVDAGTQRSVAEIPVVTVWGCRELLPTPQVRARAGALVAAQPWGRAGWERIAEGLVFDGMESWLPWLAAPADGEEGGGDGVASSVVELVGTGGLVVVVDPARVRARAAEVVDEEAALATTLAGTWDVPDRDAQFPPLHLGLDDTLSAGGAPVCSIVAVPPGPEVPAVVVESWDATAQRDPADLAARIGGLVEDGWSVTIAAEGDGSARRLAESLTSFGLPVHKEGDGLSHDDVSVRGRGMSHPGPGLSIVVQPLDHGVLLPSVKVAVLSELDLTGRRRPHRPPIVASSRAAAPGFFDDLVAGGHVVHRQHGVARYGGIVTRTVDGAQRDYLLLEYRGGDRLYVPTDQIDSVTPYGSGDSPTLSRMGGSDWARTRARVRSEVRKVVDELVDLYRARRKADGHAFAADTPWQAELEDAFPYPLTRDQARAVADVKADMEAAAPMDRLVCGDVGFGKTEVAVRAAFKAVQDGKQCAVLVPTTLLAQQHHQTFGERMAGFPVRVEALSRFLTPAQAKAVIDGLADGSIDVVVGTHRLLSEGVAFKNLGLLVVDEEQRFGVSHKEAIKALSVGVDVLTLTANPIPRTLEMGLTGIKDLSLITTPPAQRHPILTFVGAYEDAAVSEALRRELLREGQVFFVHNRVADIDHVASRLGSLVPEARIAVAHGQMDEGSLESIVLDFWQGMYDVLVCTTIVESGIDMPTVNTLVVDRADRLGLGQLHQLRGRVGRAGQRAYAYLLYPPDTTLTEEAYERLRTIGEHTELGSGFKIAMRDLEIRGAGSLLGTDQSGHIAAVGYDLYVQMVHEALEEAEGTAPAPPAEVTLDLASPAHLPTTYIEREDVRLDAYRRIAALTEPGEVADVEAEWRDRFGPLPSEAVGLLDVARLRVACAQRSITRISVAPVRPGERGYASARGKRAARALISPVRLPASAQVRLARLYPGASYREGQAQLAVPLADTESSTTALVAVLDDLLPVA